MDICRELLSSVGAVVLDIYPGTFSHWIDGVHPDDRHAVVEACGRAAERGKAHRLQFRAVTDGGDTRWIDLMLQPLKTDSGWRLVGAMVDVTAQRDRSDRHAGYFAMLASCAAATALVEEAMIGIAQVRLDGRFMVVNRRLCALLGYTADELTALDFMAISHPDEVGQDLEARTQLLTGAITSYAREKRYRRKDGSFVWANLTVSVHRDMNGAPAYFIAVVEDLTTRKQLERKGRQAHKMEAVGRLAGGIAHDFNNLLTAIVGFANLTLEQLHAAHPARGDVEEICAAGKSAASLTQQLLAFSRQQVLEPHVLDINAIIVRMRALLSRLIGEHIDLQWRLASPLDAVYADPGQIEQVVLNLSLNARDAMPDGGTLTIETSNIELDGPQVLLAISDTGVGMDDAVKEHLFEPFYTTKETGKGTGLGLATVYGVVKQSGGSIRVYSEPGHGTTIKIFLPRAERTEEVAAASPEVPATLNGTETVLIVEDQREVRSVAAETLRRHGYDVIEAAHGGDALEVAATRSCIHLLLTDAVMPGMSGRALAGRFLAERPEARVLYMSGYTNGGVAQRELIEPDAAFIQKPFAPNTLLKKVREVLRKARLEQRARHRDLA